jgi:hypothetical protein
VTELPSELLNALGQLSREEEDAILASYLSAQSKRWDFATFEELVTSPDGFGLTTATPLQRAVCRLAQGKPLGNLLEHPDVLEALGISSPDEFPALDGPPLDFFLIAAIRSAKSTFAAAAALWASQTVDLSMLSSGEIPRFPILSLSKDNAGVVMGHLLGALQKPRLRHLRIPKENGGEWTEIIKESGSDAVSSVFLWHPSGRPVETCVVAGKRAGASAISRWLFGMCLDEAPRMLGADDAVVNYQDSKRGARGRLLPGAQVWSIGSPYQPYGPIYDEVTEHFGHPTSKKIIIKARGPLMNPVWWTANRCEDLKTTDPVAYQTDVLAEFADVTETLFSQALINLCSRRAPLTIPYEPRYDYGASMDPATRSNAWTLVIARRRGRKKQVVFNQQWQGTSIEPLSPRRVLLEISAVLREYHLDWCHSDQWSADAIKDIAQDLRDADGNDCSFDIVIEEWTEKERTNCFLSLAENMKEGLIELPSDPQVHKDLKLTKKRPTNRGPSIHLAKTTDGRHCDYSPPVARVMKRWLDEEQPDLPQQGTKAFDKVFEDKMEELEIQQMEEKKNRAWWEVDPWEGQYEQ